MNESSVEFDWPERRPELRNFLEKILLELTPYVNNGMRRISIVGFA